MKMQFQVGEIIACEEVKKSKEFLCSQDVYKRQQYQVIIGNSVGNVYKEVVAAIGISDTAVGGGAAEHTEKVNPIVAALDFIAGCMTCLLYTSRCV